MSSAYVRDNSTDWDDFAKFFRWVRVDGRWVYVEYAANLSPSQWKWDMLDTTVAINRERGMGTLIILDYNNPVYGAANYKSGISTTVNRNAYCRWAVEVVKRYGTDDIIYEVWNEPQNDSCWLPTANQEDYIALCQAVTTAIRAVAPEACIVVGGGAPTYEMWETWTKDLINTHLITTTGDYDGFSIHPYTRLIPEAQLSLIPQLTGLTVPVHNTEWGWSGIFGISDSEEKRAYLYPRHVMVSDRLNMDIISVFCWNEDPLWPANQNWGLVNDAGEKTPSYYTIENLVNTLRGSHFDSVATEAGGASGWDYIYKYTNSDSGVDTLVGWTATNTGQMAIPAHAKVISNYGTITFPYLTATLSVDPIYVQYQDTSLYSNATYPALIESECRIDLGIPDKAGVTVATIMPSIVSAPSGASVTTSSFIYEHDTGYDYTTYRSVFTPDKPGTYNLFFRVVENNGVATQTTDRTVTVPASAPTYTLPQDMFGMDIPLQFVDGAEDTQRMSLLSAISGSTAMGIKHARVEVPWAEVETVAYSDPSDWAWDRVDYALNEIFPAATGYPNPSPSIDFDSVLLTLGYGNPAYGMDNSMAPPDVTPPDNEQLKAYIRFCVETVKRYNVPGVIFEIWGVPTALWDSDDFWGGSPNAVQIATLIRETAMAIRTQDPTAKLAGCHGIIGWSGTDIITVEEAIRYGSATHIDYVSVGLSRKDANPETFIAQVKRLQRICPVPILCTNWGYSAHDPTTWTAVPDANTQTALMTKGLFAGVAAGLGRIYMYTAEDINADTNICGQFAPYKYNYTGHYSPLYDYLMQRYWVIQSGMRFLGRIPSDMDTYAWAFGYGPYKQVVAYHGTEQIDFSMPTTSTVLNLVTFEETTASSGTVQLTTTPVLITYPPNYNLPNIAPISREYVRVRANTAKSTDIYDIYSTNDLNTPEGIHVNKEQAEIVTVSDTDVLRTVNPNGNTHYLGFGVHNDFLYDLPDTFGNIQVVVTILDTVNGGKLGLQYDRRGSKTDTNKIYTWCQDMDYSGGDFTPDTDPNYVLTNGSNTTKTITWTLFDPAFTGHQERATDARLVFVSDASSPLCVTTITVYSPYIPQNNFFRPMDMVVNPGNTVIFNLGIPVQVGVTTTVTPTISSQPVSSLFNENNLTAEVDENDMWTVRVQPTVTGTYVININIESTDGTNTVISNYDKVLGVTTDNIEKKSSLNTDLVIRRTR
jgi:hypothetical protein